MKLSIPPLLLLFLLQSLFIPSGKAQFGFLYNDSIPVIKSGNLLDFPWAGGLNHAQFSSIDIDFNGHDDLFIFDRSVNQIRMFKTVIENGIKGYEFLYDRRNL